MPFVPLSQRKPIPLVLDEDKQRLQTRQHDLDHRRIQSHQGAAPGISGYQYARHPLALDVSVRGPEVPFRNATAPWRPAAAEPDGPASQRDREQASCGAYWEASHSMRKSLSSPTLQNASDAMLACHPLTIELNRWEKLARVTKRELGDQIPERKPRSPEAPLPPRQGLILFPKYMLLNNCHLKTTDLQRFQREEEQAARESKERAKAEPQFPASPSGCAKSHSNTSSRQRQILRTNSSASRTTPMPIEASWGAPKLHIEDSIGGPHWAGNPLPSGQCQRTSNPLRMG